MYALNSLCSWLFRNNTKPKQESFEFKASQAAPPQLPTQQAAQVINTPFVYSPAHSSISCLYQTPNHLTLFQTTTPIVFSKIQPSCFSSQTPIHLLLRLVSTNTPPTFPRTNNAHFYLFIFLQPPDVVIRVVAFGEAYLALKMHPSPLCSSLH